MYHPQVEFSVEMAPREILSETKFTLSWWSVTAALWYAAERMFLP